MFRTIPFAVAAALVFGCGPSKSPQRFTEKLVIIGFDGLDPDLVRPWIDEGKLPNLKKLADEGGLYRLETTHSPESPTAWASFATGVNAGKHNIYDFLVRDTATYLPELGMVRRQPPRFLFNYVPISRPKISSLRGGTSFWVTAGRAGVRSSILTVPITFPPEEVPNGELLSGLPLPDIRGTMGTFHYYATDLTRYEEGSTEFGGILRRLVFDGTVAMSELSGPPNPTVEGRDRDIRVPVRIEWKPGSPTARFSVQDTTLDLRRGQWSAWFPLEFRINALVRLHGMAQVFLVRADEELQIYVSPVNWVPDRPPTPMSAPAHFAGDLYERLGWFRTLGWAEATWPLNENRIDEQTFMDDLYRAFEDRARVIRDRLGAGAWDLLVGVIESTDRVQHMMWRFMDPAHPMYDAALAARFGSSIEDVYRRSDGFVGDVLALVPPGTAVMVVSDHGFNSFRQSVNLNTWLVQEGYMVMRGRGSAEKKLDDLFGGGQFWEHVDWSRTRAYAMGLGQIYFNLRGREGQGIVNPGADYRRLADELSADLLTMTDPATGTKVVRAVYKRDDVYKGDFLANASDLQVGLEDGYRVSWQTTLGGAPPGVLYPNARKWSGDHGAYDYRITEGTLVTNRRVTAAATRITDIAPTVLKYFGIPIPKDIDGAPLF